MTNTASQYDSIDYGGGFLGTDGSGLAEIKVGIADRLGDIIEVVTLETLVRTGNQLQLHIANYGCVGEVVYELWTPGTEELLRKLGYLRSLQAAGMVPPGKHSS